MVAGLGKSLDKQVERGKLEPSRARPGRCRRVTATHDLHALADCDLVIESVVEDLDVKKELFRAARPRRQGRRDPRHQHVDAAGRRAGDGDRAARAGVRHPLLQPGADDEPGRDRPAAHRQRRDDRRRRAGFAEACGKEPVEVKDRAGFIVNALLFPYLNNAVRMLETGTASPRRHRRRDEGRLQLPDGPAGAARPRRPRHVARDPRRAVRRVPRSELRGRADAAPHGHRRPPRPEVEASASTTTGSRRAAGRRRPVPVGSPPADEADEHGIVGIGADLEPATLLAAYRRGRVPDAARSTAGRWRGGRRTRGRSSRSTVCASAGRCASRAHRFEIRVDTALRGRDRRVRRPRAGRAAGSPPRSATRTSSCTGSAGRTASRRGHGTRTPRAAGCTASPSAACSRASRCSIAAPTRRRSRSSAWSTGCTTRAGRDRVPRPPARRAVADGSPRLARRGRDSASFLPGPARGSTDAAVARGVPLTGEWRSCRTSRG